MSNCPLAQASIRAPPGFARSVKPFSCRNINGKPSSKAARMTAFSPGEMAGETSTAPCRAAARYFLTVSCISASVRRREHCTWSRMGRSSRKRLPMAENVVPAAVTLRWTRNRSGCSRFMSNPIVLKKKSAPSHDEAALLGKKYHIAAKLVLMYDLCKFF